MSEADIAQFKQVIGQAALKLWPDLPRDVQESLFEYAVGGDVILRHKLAQYLHDPGGMEGIRGHRRNSTKWKLGQVRSEPGRG